MAEPVDVTATILREMRQRFDQLDRRMDRVDKRMDGIEQRMDGLETGLHGVQVVLVNMIGTRDHRIGALEAKVS
jgi:hypothetical protein